MTNQDGRWSDDHTHFIYDYEKIAKETGYSVDQVKLLGVSHCRRFPISRILEKPPNKALYEGTRDEGRIKDLSSLYSGDFSSFEARALTQMFIGAKVQDSSAHDQGKIVGGMFDKNGDLMIQTDHGGVPTIIDHDNTVLQGYTGPVILRHPMTRGEMTAPMELVLYKDGQRYVVHEYNMQDKGKYGGGYHNWFSDALADFAGRLEREQRHLHTTVPWTYSPDLVLR